MAKETIPVFFTIDDQASLYLETAIRSLMANASQTYDYKIYILYKEIGAAYKEAIEGMAKDPFEIEFVQMEEGFKGIEDRPENRLRCDFFTPSIFYRIFLGDMFPQYDKGIYIDSDVIIPGDISKLYEIDLGDNILAGCPDFSVMEIEDFANYIERAVGVPRTEYINSGMLLLNMKMMREVHFADHFLTLMNTYHFNSIAPDQDYINAMTYGKKILLDECWDAMPPVGSERPLVEDPQIIHFNLFWKPWCYDDTPYEEYYWVYANESPFYDEIMEYKANYSDERKATDQEVLNRMLTNAVSIQDEDVTFRKIYESGGDVRI